MTTVQKSFKTEDFAPEILKASEIPASGIVVQYEGIDSMEGKQFGEFFAMHCIHEGKLKDIWFSSAKLFALTKKIEESILHKKIKILRRGTGVNTNYTVEMVD